MKTHSQRAWGGGHRPGHLPHCCQDHTQQALKAWASPGSPVGRSRGMQEMANHNALNSTGMQPLFPFMGISFDYINKNTEGHLLPEQQLWHSWAQPAPSAGPHWTGTQWRAPHRCAGLPPGFTCKYTRTRTHINANNIHRINMFCRVY